MGKGPATVTEHKRDGWFFTGAIHSVDYYYWTQTEHGNQHADNSNTQFKQPYWMIQYNEGQLFIRVPMHDVELPLNWAMI